MNQLETHFSSKKQDWGTPQSLFDELNNEFHFTLDVCASDWNAKCTKYFSEEDDGLTQDWTNEICWCNPPYNEVKLWIEKARREKALTVVLTFARTDTKWFHENVYYRNNWQFRPNTQVRFLKGRLKFENLGGKNNPAPTPSILIIFDNRNNR